MANEGEIRFAVAMNGGVSLAVWIGGVCDELLQLRVQGNDDQFDVDATAPDHRWSPYQLACWVAGRRPRVDVMAGASAGGLNSVFLGLGLIHGHPNLAALRDLWIEQASFESLLRSPRDPDLRSLMQGDDFFLPRLTEAVAALLPDDSTASQDGPPVHVVLTATSLRGHRRRIEHSEGDDETEKSHNVLLRFRHGAKDGDTTIPSDFAVTNGEDMHTRDRIIARLARACRSTASFPGAFEPSEVAIAATRSPKQPKKRPDLLRSDNFVVRPGVRLPTRDLLIDGGTLVNLPVQAALDAVFAQRSDGPVRRIFATVVPDPSTDDAEPDVTRASTFEEVVFGALSTIPRNETIADALSVVDDHNQLVDSTWTARAALLEHSLDELCQVAATMFPSYRARRLAVSAERYERHLRRRLDQERLHAVSDTARHLWFDSLVGLESPTVPNGLNVDDDELNRWGLSTVRRSAARVLAMIRDVEDSDPSRHVMTTVLRKIVNATLTAAGDISTVDSSNAFDELVLLPDPASAEDARAALRACAQRGQAGRLETARHLRSLGAAAVGLSDGGPLALRDAQDSTAGIRFLLALEVIEQSFGGFGHVVEQRVETLRIDGLCTSPLDTVLRRDRPAAKVAGVQLSHFGSFLKSTWRANDWMWGRLDGAHDLLELILSRPLAGRAEQALAMLGEPDGDAEQSGERLRDALCRRRHAEVVLDEAPVMARAIDADAAGGVRELRATRQLALAIAGLPKLVADDPTTADAPASTNTTADTTADVNARWTKQVDAASALLAVHRVGEEKISDYGGSDLVIRVGTQTLATGAGVLHQAVPGIIKTPVNGVRYFSLVLWSFVKGALGGPVARTMAGIAFGLGAGIVALRLFAGGEPAFLLPIALALLFAGIVVGTARAPFASIPLIGLGIVPLALSKLSVRKASWWPSNVGWPSLRDAWGGIPVVGFALAVFCFGAATTPAWVRPMQRDLRGARRRLDLLTTRAAQPAYGEGATPTGFGRLLAAIGLAPLYPVTPAKPTEPARPTKPTQSAGATAPVAPAHSVASFAWADRRHTARVVAAAIGVAMAIAATLLDRAEHPALVRGIAIAALVLTVGWMIAEAVAFGSSRRVGPRPHGLIWSVLPFVVGVAISDIVATGVEPDRLRPDLGWVLGCAGPLAAIVVGCEGLLLALLLRLHKVPVPRLLASVVTSAAAAVVAWGHGLHAVASDGWLQHAVYFVIVMLIALPAVGLLRLQRYSSRSLWGPLLTVLGVALALGRFLP